MTASSEQVATAILAALNAELAPWQAYDLDDARVIKTNHVQVTVAQRYVPAERVARETLSGWRVTTRAVGLNVSNARELERGCIVALGGRQLTIAGRTTTPFRRESAEPVGEDDGMYSGMTIWTFAL